MTNLYRVTNSLPSASLNPIGNPVNSTQTSPGTTTAPYSESRKRCAPDDNPTLGLILCSDKIDAVVKYTLDPNQQPKIFASRYQLRLPTEAELQAELHREMAQLQDRQPPNSEI